MRVRRGHERVNLVERPEKLDLPPDKIFWIGADVWWRRRCANKTWNEESGWEWFIDLEHGHGRGLRVKLA